MKRWVVAGVGVLVFVLIVAVTSTRDDEQLNLPAPTLGGAQFWNDEVLLGGWRVQRHVGTGHCRLLDADNFRQAWGQGDACVSALNTRRADGLIVENPDEITLLVHGLAGYGWTFREMAPVFRQAGVQAEYWNYASTQASVRDHAAAFHQMMNGLMGVRRVNLVAHSMGGLVLRTALADGGQPWRTRISVGRVYMIATPNQGAYLADRVEHDGWYQGLLADVGPDLTSLVVSRFPVPDYAYCLIAGQLPKGGNPLIPGEDDGMVGVDEVKLRKTDPVAVFNASHHAITAKRDVIDYILAGLKTDLADSSCD